MPRRFQHTRHIRAFKKLRHIFPRALFPEHYSKSTSFQKHFANCAPRWNALMETAGAFDGRPLLQARGPKHRLLRKEGTVAAGP